MFVLLQRASRVVIFTAALFALASCESSEERAEKHFQSGMELLEAGDVDRAMVEFRNVFQLKENHLEARRAFAGILLERGKIVEAYRNYLFVAEQSPEDTEALLILAELAAGEQLWEEAERHYTAIVDRDPENPRIRAVGLSLAYRDAIRDDDTALRRELSAEAEGLVEDLPESMLVRRLLIDSYSRDQRPDDALEQIDRAIELEPDSRALYDVRLSLLAQLADADGLQIQLQDMIELFPDDPNLEAALLRFYLSQGLNEEAESYLRDRVTKEDSDEGAAVDLVRFLVQMKGMDAGIAELEKLLEEEPDNLTLVALRASLLFDSGQTEEGMEILETALEGSEPGTTANQALLALARMHIAVGNEVGARRRVEEILAVDPSNVEALKLSAGWLIAGDQPEQAIQALRTALDQAPDDASIMTLMAQAHERNGSHQLAKEMLALAVERSNNAPEASLRYAQVLLNDGSTRAAEDVLVNSLRLNVNNVALLNALGQLYVRDEDWARANQVIGTLRREGSDPAMQSADALQVAIFSGQDRTDETVEFLEQLAKNDQQTAGARVAIARAHLASGNEEAAVRSIETSLEEDPESLTLKFAAGAIYASTGAFETAETTFREITEEAPGVERVWIELMRVLYAQGESDEALATLDRGLEALPGAPNLLWARASVLERNGDYEGAIGVYETMYEANSSAPVIANNLASMITTYRTDEESLERAYAVAKRLRGIEVPAFQDTYGWIAYRRGELEEALEHLEPAAEGLPDDPLVQYHLAKTYLALERNEDALTHFRKSVEAAGGSDLRPQIAEARQQVRDLDAAKDSE
jgi:tetratricopeptide (TPR) repeat protein